MITPSDVPGHLIHVLLDKNLRWIHHSGRLRNETAKALFEPLKEAGIVIKEGKFSEDEDAILRRNWELLKIDLEVKEDETPRMFAGFGLKSDTGRVKECLSRAMNCNFWPRMCDGLLNRTGRQVATRFHRIFNEKYAIVEENRRTGPNNLKYERYYTRIFTDEEVKTLWKSFKQSKGNSFVGSHILNIPSQIVADRFLVLRNLSIDELPFDKWRKLYDTIYMQMKNEYPDLDFIQCIMDEEFDWKSHLKWYKLMWTLRHGRRSIKDAWNVIVKELRNTLELCEENKLEHNIELFTTTFGNPPFTCYLLYKAGKLLIDTLNEMSNPDTNKTRKIHRRFKRKILSELSFFSGYYTGMIDPQTYLCRFFFTKYEVNSSLLRFSSKLSKIEMTECIIRSLILLPPATIIIGRNVVRKGSVNVRLKTACARIPSRLMILQCVLLIAEREGYFNVSDLSSKSIEYLSKTSLGNNLVRGSDFRNIIHLNRMHIEDMLRESSLSNGIDEDVPLSIHIIQDYGKRDTIYEEENEIVSPSFSQSDNKPDVSSSNDRVNDNKDDEEIGMNEEMNDDMNSMDKENEIDHIVNDEEIRKKRKRKRNIEEDNDVEQNHVEYNDGIGEESRKKKKKKKMDEELCDNDKNEIEMTKKKKKRKITNFVEDEADGTGIVKKDKKEKKKKNE